MRIRKNAARVFEGKKRSSSSYLICQLNRPPWDDDSFFTQGYWDNDLPFHGTSTSNASLPALNSLVSEEPMDLSFECVPERENGGGVDDGGIGAGEDCPVLLLTMGSSEPTPLDMVLPTPATTVLPKKRGRPRKSTSGASAGNNNNTNSNCNSNSKGSSNNKIDNDDNPYQFYYYSGFGPSWSKRRGKTKFNSVPEMDNCNGNGNAYNGSGNSNSYDNIMDDDENKDSLSKSDNSNKHEIESFKSVIDAQRELDYIEDEEDEEEWYGGGRVRKPIKARSLKSLM
ncbi:uncharacterized protein LOC141605097 [Silene latifolia]|uniref:uncharacterized protein LOC141605097 n=1 Tax=Silene latifolia TaxID=37657 RepID=UPI003D7791E9